ncbi:MAG TPA: hypothetical protein VGZ73_06720 [Bryobacteraceae bacterium]|jgi:hypothetical protein|nr:hypothetical protein [Bryobacteraceae bacterium]
MILSRLRVLLAVAALPGACLGDDSILYGSALADGNTHQKTNLPLLVAGRSGARRGGRHIVNSGKEPVSNLFLALMDSVGAPMDSFADSTSRLQL